MTLSDEFIGVCKATDHQADRVRRVEEALFAEQLRLAALNAARARLLRQTLSEDLHHGTGDDTP